MTGTNESHEDAARVVHPAQTSAAPVALPRDTDRFSSRVLDGISVDWIAGLVMAATGGLLALTGLTLPWAAAPPVSGGVSELVPLSDLNAVAGPIAAFILSTAVVGAAISFSSGSPWATMLRLVTMVETMATSILYLFLTGYLTVGRQLATATPRATPGGLSPSVGCFLYCGGLVMIGLGVAGSQRWLPPAGSGVAATAPSPARVVAHRVSVGVALAAALASAALPLYRTAPSRYGGTSLASFGPGPGDVRAWMVGYRVGLAVCLLIVVLALVRPAAGVRLRGPGLAVAVAVTTALLMGYLVLWLPLSPFVKVDSGVYATLRPEPGYHLSIVSMVLLGLGFVLLPDGPVNSGAGGTGTNETAPTADPAPPAAASSGQNQER